MRRRGELTVAEAAALVGRAPMTIYQAIRAGKLKTRRLRMHPVYVRQRKPTASPRPRIRLRRSDVLALWPR